MSSQFRFLGKSFQPLPSRSTSPAYSFDFNLPPSTSHSWEALHRSHRSDQPENSAKNSPCFVVDARTITSYPISSSAPTSTTLSHDPVKQEEPDSPKIIIEPLLPLSKRSSSSSPEPHSPPTQAELETQLLLSQSLAPPTEVPLRATQACDEMRQMMRSFRLNPFSMFTGKDTKSESNESDSVFTWCGEIPKPLDEEPLIFEWQLVGYSSGLEDKLADLITPEDTKGCLDIFPRKGVPSSLEGSVPREDPKSQMFSSQSEVANNSDFSTPSPADRESCHFGRIGSLSMIPKIVAHDVRFDVRERDTEQGSDSGYESNNSVFTTSSLAFDSSYTDDSSLSYPNSFRDQSFPQKSLHDSYKKPRTGFSQPHALISHNNRLQAILHSKSSHHPILNTNSTLHTLRKPGSEGSLNISRHSKGLAYGISTLNSAPDSRRRSLSGSMYIPTLLNTDSTKPSSSYLPRSGPATCPSSSLDSSSHSLPSAQDVMNITRIWETAANPQIQVSESESIDQLYRTVKSAPENSTSSCPHIFAHVASPSQPGSLPLEQQRHSSGLSLLDTLPGIATTGRMSTRMGTGMSMESRPVQHRQYYDLHQQQLEHAEFGSAQAQDRTQSFPRQLPLNSSLLHRVGNDGGVGNNGQYMSGHGMYPTTFQGAETYTLTSTGY